MRRISDLRRCHRGFTLVEAIVVMVVTSILAATVAVFIRGPVQAYFDTVRRADLADTADGALRRLTRELQGALPNSVRVSPDGQFIEFLPVLDAGRYRTDVPGNVLDFSSAPAAGQPVSFDVLGPSVSIAPGSSIVIYNLGQPGADAYEQPASNLRPVVATGTGLGSVTFTSSGSPFPFASPANRFQVVGTPVTYVCVADAANPDNGVLRRYSGYGIQASQPTSEAALKGLSGVSSAIAAGQVQQCTISYNNSSNSNSNSEVLLRNGLVTLTLSLSKGGETVALLQQVNLVNTP